MDDFMKLMMLSGNLNHITEPDLFSDKKNTKTTPYQTTDKMSNSTGTERLQSIPQGSAEQSAYTRWYKKEAKTNVVYNRGYFETMKRTVDAEEALAKSCGIDYTYGLHVDTPISSLMQTDLISFYIYLAAIDGHIAEKEASVISEIMGAVSAKELAEIADEVCQHESDMEIPLFLKFLTLAERGLGARGMGTHGRVCIQAIDMFEGLGKTLISADGMAKEIEIKKLNQYVRKMRQGAAAIFRGQG